MDAQKINTFIISNGDKFAPSHVGMIRQQLEQMDDNGFYAVMSASYQSPTTILIIAILLGWERFFLDDVALGLLKIFTCQGCLIWWLIDICTAKSRTQEYNYKKFQQAVMSAGA